MTRAERAAEQDMAAGSRDKRAVPTTTEVGATASISLRVPQPGRRIYAYLRWAIDHRTIERYVGEVSGASRAELLADGWRQVSESALLPTSAADAQLNSWASTPSVRAVMQANPGKDTKPERALRSLLHGMGLRYRVDQPPIPGMRMRADIVFPREKVAIFVDGCFWHGCPEHYRPGVKHSEFWRAKLDENRNRDNRADRLLTDNGWTSIRIWEHENLGEAASKVAARIRGGHRA